MTEGKKHKSSLTHSPDIHPTVRIHPTAIIEDGVSIGKETSIWDSVHIRKNTVIGKNCIVGEKTYIAYNVSIGHSVKINSLVYICTGVTIENYVMISAGTIFTNDRLPRAFAPDGISIKTSDPTEETLETRVCRGATIGAGCIIGPGVELGQYCMIGMGSVVTHDVVPYQLIYGNPAKPMGFVCLCGEILFKSNKFFKINSLSVEQQFICSKCNRKYTLIKNNQLALL